MQNRSKSKECYSNNANGFRLSLLLQKLWKGVGKLMLTLGKTYKSNCYHIIYDDICLSVQDVGRIKRALIPITSFLDGVVETMKILQKFVVDAIHSLKTCLEILSFMDNSTNQGHGKTLKKFVHLEGEVIESIEKKSLSGKNINDGKILKNIGKNKENVIIEIKTIFLIEQQNEDLTKVKLRNPIDWNIRKIIPSLIKINGEIKPSLL